MICTKIVKIPIAHFINLFWTSCERWHLPPPSAAWGAPLDATRCSSSLWGLQWPVGVWVELWQLESAGVQFLWEKLGQQQLASLVSWLSCLKSHQLFVLNAETNPTVQEDAYSFVNWMQYYWRHELLLWYSDFFSSINRIGISLHQNYYTFQVLLEGVVIITCFGLCGRG